MTDKIYIPNKVSVIISTYNRYKYLLKAIQSVQNQTYKNIEIIVVNDCSTEKDYYEKNEISNMKNIKIYHLEKNSREILGKPCMSIPKNYGAKQADGEYIAFLDDDDYWFPNKIEIQLNEMFKYKCSMACSNSYTGIGLYNGSINFDLYFKKRKFKNVFSLKDIKNENILIMSSVIIKRNIFDLAGGWDETIPLGGLNGKYEDYELWKKCLMHTNCTFVNHPLLYYDNGHGYGQDY